PSLARRADRGHARPAHGRTVVTAPKLAPSVHDGLAVTAFVLAFFCPPLGVILGWVSISAANRDGRRSSGLAQAGLTIGLLLTVVLVIAVIAVAHGASQVP